MIKPRLPRWPAEIPGGGTALDRARTIACALYNARHREQEMEAIVAFARNVGELWLFPHPMTNHSDLMTRDEAAALAGVQRRTIDQWVQRGHIHHHPGGYSEREILDYLQKRRDTPPEPGETAA
uniref:helix-turn-helix domain-containing protein n=1 Tax=Pseudonocardia sp. CA-138482 TaxID=3240023 RepID=UPI003F49A447